MFVLRIPCVADATLIGGVLRRRKIMSRSWRLMGGLVIAALAVGGDWKARAWDLNADVVIEWNRILQETLPPPTALRGPRHYAMMHIAMFDAVNAIEREYEPYRVRLRHASGSTEAAAAQAAHDVLYALIPTDAARARYDAALAARLGTGPSGFVRQGASVGALVASEVLAWRQNDGWANPVPAPPAYVNPSFPGLWQLTPGMAAATFTHLQNAAPMALLTATQFLPAPPPALNSARYATDLNEVKRVGGLEGAPATDRTPDQTQIARLWAGVGTTTNLFAIWNNIARDAAVARDLSLVEAARLFVFMNVSIHDTLQSTQVSKYVYGLWRPVTAIRNAHLDLNDATEQQADWTSLLTNPPYPAYAGNMAGVGASAATALRLALGTDAMPVAATWRLTAGGEVTHNFGGFWAAAQEQSESRIFGGLHYRFDQVAGQECARKVAEFAFANYMGARDRRDD